MGGPFRISELHIFRMDNGTKRNKKMSNFATYDKYCEYFS